MTKRTKIKALIVAIIQLILLCQTPEGIFVLGQLLGLFCIVGMVYLIVDFIDRKFIA